MREPTGAGWVYGCAVCRDRPEAQAICPCCCGSSHSLCFDCLNAMADLGLVKEDIINKVSPDGTELKFNRHSLLKCPSQEEVRAAVLIGKR